MNTTDNKPTVTALGPCASYKARITELEYALQRIAVTPLWSEMKRTPANASRAIDAAINLARAALAKVRP